MNLFDAWHLPGISAHELRISEQRFDELTARVPALTPVQLEQVAAHIQHARRQYLLPLPARAIAAAIDAAAATLADSSSEEGAAARALLPLATGYSSETIEDVLMHMTSAWRAESLDQLLVSELGDPEVLDHPTVPPGAACKVLARGPRLAFHVFSGNVPGVAVTSIVRSLLVKAATVGKCASGEPVLPILFARALAKAAPRIAECLAVTYWRGGSVELEDVLLATADTVIVYGGDDAVAALAARTPPDTRLITHGPRLSFGVVGALADSDDVAVPIARAVAAYDQQGCVSPHVVFVEKGGAVDARRLAAAISAELERLGRLRPRRRLSTGEAVALRSARTSAEFRSIGGAAVEIFGVERAQHTVIYEETNRLPVSCLNRTLYVVPVDGAESVTGFIEPHRRLMQSAALAGFDEARTEEIASLLGDFGVSRITTFDALPWPPMSSHHDGRGPLQELLTWTDLSP